MKSIAVFGLGQFGSQLAITLSQKGFDVIAIDKKSDIVNELKELVAQAIILDSTDEKAMRAVNIDHVDKAIVAIGSNMQSSLLTTALLQKMNIQDIYVRAIDPLQESILRSMGLKNIINIEKDMGLQIANTISAEGIGRYIEISDEHSLMEITVPKALIGKTLKDLHLRLKHKINIVGIKSRLPEVTDAGEICYRSKMTVVPEPAYPLQKDDRLVIAGSDSSLGKFIKTWSTDND